MPNFGEAGNSASRRATLAASPHRHEFSDDTVDVVWRRRRFGKVLRRCGVPSCVDIGPSQDFIATRSHSAQLYHSASHAKRLITVASGMRYGKPFSGGYADGFRLVARVWSIWRVAVFDQPLNRFGIFGADTHHE